MRIPHAVSIARGLIQQAAPRLPLPPPAPVRQTSGVLPPELGRGRLVLEAQLLVRVVAGFGLQLVGPCVRHTQ